LLDSTTGFPDANSYDLLKPSDPELTLLVFQGDSLVYWSDNRVPFYSSPFLYEPDKPLMIHLANGWYEMLIKRKGNYLVAGLCLIKQDFPFQNQFLNNRYTYPLALPDEVAISTEEGEYNIYSSRGAFLCSLTFYGELIADTDEGWMVIFLIFSYLFFIAFLYHFYFGGQQVVRGNRKLILMIVLDIVIVRSIQFALHFPESLIQSELFGPAL